MGKSGQLGDAGQTMMKPLFRVLIVSVVCGLTSCVSFPRMEAFRDPLTPFDHVALGNAYLAGGDRPSAREQYEAAVKQNGRWVPALIGLGNMAFEDNHLNKARSYFRRALKAAPQNAGVINNLAMVDVVEGRHLDRAKALLEDALPTAGSTKPYLLDSLANIAIKQGRLQDATLALDQAEAAVPAKDAVFHKHLQETREKMKHLPGPNR